jgi:hypothetical protein
MTRERKEHLTNHIAPYWVSSLNSLSHNIPWIFHNSGHLNMLFPLSWTGRLPPIHQDSAQMSPALDSFSQLPKAKLIHLHWVPTALLYFFHEIYFSFKISIARFSRERQFTEGA